MLEYSEADVEKVHLTPNRLTLLHLPTLYSSASTSPTSQALLPDPNNFRETSTEYTINMSPPSATTTSTVTDPHTGTKLNTTVPHEVGVPEVEAKLGASSFPKPPKFDDKYKEREYLKGRLAAAFRIFGKYGFDEGVAGHITLRVLLPSLSCRLMHSQDSLTSCAIHTHHVSTAKLTHFS